MPRRTPLTASMLATVIVAVFAIAACGSERSPAARAEPEVVVRSSSDRTRQGASVRVEAAAPDATSSGVLRLDGADQRLTLVGRGSAKGYPELEDPLGVVDLVRGATTVVPYGGTAVRGTSTFRYQIVIDSDKAVSASPPNRQAALWAFAARLGAARFYADVWIDDEGRLRRVQLPLEKTTRRPVQRESPRLVTVDLFDYET